MARILLVEDDKIIQKIMQRRLKIDGHDVFLADDGIEGVALAQSEKPDLILMDMLLPRLNGWLATEQIKSQSDVPIIALTGAGSTDDKQKMLAAGCTDYVIKPVNFAELTAKIDALLT
jgi:DNA-binding response OmpR family regulator